VHCFRPAEKIEWTGELNTFTGDMMENPVPSGIVDENRLVSIGSGVEKGLRYTKYAHSPRTSLVVYGADDLAVGAKAAECLCRFYDIPPIIKVPLFRCNYKARSAPARATKNAVAWIEIDYAHDLRTGTVIHLETKSCTKVPFNASDFQLPHGYKTCKVTQVAYSRHQKESMNEVFNDMGFASDQKDAAQTPATSKVVPPARDNAK
jgi:hypothetical protein